MSKNDYGASHWSSNKVWARRKKEQILKDADFLQKEIEIPLITSRISLMAMHGALCLALRHPGFKGPSRGMVQDITKQIGKYLVNEGILTSEELLAAERLERDITKAP